MNLLNLILRLVYRFVPFEAGEFEKMKADAEKWYTDIRTDDAAESDKNQKPVLVKIKRHAEQWYAKLGCAVLYIYLVKTIAEWMRSKDEEDEEDE